MMAQFRPAGLSDEDTDSDEYGFYEKPTRRNIYQPQNQKNDFEDAILNGNLKEVEKIISSDVVNKVNMKLNGGWSPLMHACFHAQDKIVSYLLSKGADPNFHADSVTPIMMACSNCSTSNDAINNIVEDLLDKDCIINVGDKYGETPLMRAISSGRIAVVQKFIDLNVNIEMRDQKGWTAAFWAVQHNQPEILELLISKGARLSEVDRNNRTVLDIASSHDYQNIIEILKKHLNIRDDDEPEKNTYIMELTTWHEFYPGIRNDKLTYASEIPHLLYGMNCETLTNQIMNSGMDLRTFLLLEEKDMLKLGIDMPYERQRLKTGLQNFHKRGWKLNAVAGLYAQKMNCFSVLDCLTALGNHLQQLYILEATLQYTLREYNAVQSQIKFEPLESPMLVKMKTAAKKLLTNINNIRKEMKSMNIILGKVSKCNPQPADFIKERTLNDVAMGYLTEAVVVFSIGYVIYQVKTFFSGMLNK